MRMLLLGSAFAVFSTSLLADDIAIETATGPVTVADTPKSIAVFDVAAIDTLNALGADVTGIPDKLYVSYLDAVLDTATVVGTLFEPNYETLAVMGPDLIIIGGRSSTLSEPLAEIAPVIDMTISNEAPSGDSIVAQGRARIAAYGALLGKEDDAAALIADLDAKIAEAQAAAEGRGNALIVLTNGAKISAFGATSRFGWLHDTVGIPVAAEGLDAETHGQSISFEFIAETDPDWIFVVDRGAAIGQDGVAAAATLDNPLVNNTRAVQNGQVVYLGSAPLYIAGGGATSMMTTLDEIIAAFTEQAG
ncbi:siderophore ABC transporter substrate-binding protein [Loktanella agnita]|uniref:siderophore ABC transporter substrate-binding protein n=1 Tax=Loktanella agnita TaxID=287097 RepID=UPI0039889552